MEQPTRFADAMMGVGWLVESAKAVELHSYQLLWSKIQWVPESPSSDGLAILDVEQ